MVDKNDDIGISDEEFERMYVEATQRGKEKMERLPKARSARIDAKSLRLILELETGVTVMVPVEMIQGLQTDDIKALRDFDLVLLGTQIHWHKLDVQFYVEDFLNGVFGTKKWMASLKEHLAEIGRKGGSAKTPAKRAASAENGKKGGRPKKARTA